MQKDILKMYLELNQHPTLKTISMDTGIQLTRVFRLMNGSKMKVCEYQIFHQKVKNQMGFEHSLEILALECSKKLSIEAIKEIELELKRKLTLWDLLQKSQLKPYSALQSHA